MGFYSLNNNFNIIDEMDGTELKKILEKKFNLCENESELIVLLKKLIKHESNFKEFLSEINYEMEEFFKICIHIYPTMWNHHLINFVRDNYLFKKLSDIEKL